MNTLLPGVRIGHSQKTVLPLGMGGSFYGRNHGQRQGEAGILDALEAALENDITHFDTATGYGDGYSERLLRQFITAQPNRRERLFLASKAHPEDISARTIIAAIDAS